MKKTIFSLAIVALTLIAAACGSNKTAETAGEQTTDALTVDEVLTNPEQYVNDTLTIEGVCSHLCRHGGRKAFLQGNADNMQLRCEAYPLMGENFPATTIHRPMTVVGVLREQRIDNETVAEMERQYAEQIKQLAEQEGEERAELESIAAAGCDTERAARGQQDLTTFQEQMDDYRARIAARQAKDGKSYISFYYLDAISYQTLPD